MATAKIEIKGVIGLPNKNLEKQMGEELEYFSADNMAAFLAEPTTQEADRISVVIKSIGGDVNHGLKIYDMLQAEKRKGKTIETIGHQFDSIASVIMAAGDTRESIAGASPLFHTAWLSPADLDEDMELNSQALENIKKTNDLADSQMLGVYANVVGRDNVLPLKQLMDNSTQLSDKQLLDLGFSTKIISGSRAANTFAPLAYNSRNMVTDAPVAKVHEYADMIARSKGKFLIIQRAASEEFEPNKWAFAGGKIESGEKPSQAAIRELKEETGYTVNKPILVDRVENPDGTISHYYTGEIVGEYEPDPNEVQNKKFISPAQLEGLNLIRDSFKRYKNLMNTIMSQEVKDQKNVKVNSLIDKMLAFFGAAKAMSVTTNDGLVLNVEDGIAYTTNEAGEQVPAEAGDYPMADGTILKIADGGVVAPAEEVPAVAAEPVVEEETLEQKIAAAVAKALADKEAEQMALNAKKEEEEKALNAKKEEEAKAMVAQLNAVKKELNEAKSVVVGDEKDEAEVALMAVKKHKDEMKKLKPSERRLMALKSELAKGTYQN